MPAQHSSTATPFVFPGARAVILGATGAIGSTAAAELSSRGAELALSGRNETRLSALSDELGAMSSLPADIREAAEAARVVEVSAAALGGLDLLINAAGVVAFGPAAGLSSEIVAELIAVNLQAPMAATTAALRIMESGGVIVNVSGVVAEAPTAGMAAYSASKAGLMAFDAAVAREARRAGVRVLDARPPHLDTGMETRAIAGEPPKLPPGADPLAAVTRIVDAIADPRAREVVWRSSSAAA